MHLPLLPQRLSVLEPIQRPPEWMGEDKDTDRRSLRKGIAWWKGKKESEKILSICNQSWCQIINAGAEEVQVCFVRSADVIEQHSLAVKALFLFILQTQLCTDFCHWLSPLLTKQTLCTDLQVCNFPHEHLITNVTRKVCRGVSHLSDSIGSSSLGLIFELYLDDKFGKICWI